MTASMIPKARIPPTTPPIRALLLPLPLLELDELGLALEVADSVCSVGESEVVDVVGLEGDALVLGFMLVLVPVLVLLFPVVITVSGRDGVPSNAGLGDGPEIPPGIDQTVPACGCVVAPVPVFVPVTASVVVALPPIPVFVCAASVVIVVPINGPFIFPAVAVTIDVLELSLNELVFSSWFAAFPSGQTPVLHGLTEQQPLKSPAEQV